MTHVVCLGATTGKKGVDTDKSCKDSLTTIEGEAYSNTAETCKLEIDVQSAVELTVQQSECCTVPCCVTKCLTQLVACSGVKGTWTNALGCSGGVETVCTERHCEGCALSYISCVDTDPGPVEVKIIHGTTGAKIRTPKGEASEYDLTVSDKCSVIELGFVGEGGGCECGDCFDWGDCCDCCDCVQGPDCYVALEED